MQSSATLRFCCWIWSLAAAVLLVACNSGPGQLASPPGAPVIALLPEVPSSAENLSVEVRVDSADFDGDLHGYRYRWSVDGELRHDLEDSPVVPAPITTRGELWQVQVRGEDALGHVGPPATASAMIGNSPPTVEVAVVPNPAATDADLVLEMTTADSDGDVVSLTISWARNGTVNSSYDGLSEIPASYTEEGDEWSVEVVPFDGLDEGQPQIVTVLVGNAAPIVNNFSIGPDPPREGDTLSASATVTDPDGDWVTVSYQWFVDGEALSGEVSTALSSEHFDKGQEVWAEVAATDSQGAQGELVQSNRVVVENTPPSVAAVELSPASGGEESTFVCLPLGWLDPDPADQQPSYALSWWVNGGQAVAGDTISGTHFDKHDELHCRVTPSDSEGAGPTQHSALVAVDNTPPAAVSVVIVASDGATEYFETTVLTAVPDGYSDPDPADAIADWQFQWFVSGQAVSAAGQNLDGTYFDRGQEVVVAAYPFDGEEAGSAVSSSPVLIANTPPSIAAVQLEPDPAYTHTDVSAVPVGWNDPDDPPGYRFAWTVGGVAVGGDSAVLESHHFSLGASVQVTVTPDDGIALGLPRTSTPLVISDAPPAQPVVQIQPQEVSVGLDDLLCSYSAATLDPDGHSVSHSIAWLLDGNPFSASSTNLEPDDTIASVHLGIGQEWTCQVTASDTQQLTAIGQDAVVIRAPWFSLTDVNGSSVSAGQQVTPRDYLGQVSAWYFGDASATASVQEFDCLEDQVQAELDLQHAGLGVQILGINAVGAESGNPLITGLVDLPWLQDLITAPVVDAWGAALRQLVILDGDNLPVQHYDLASLDICDAVEAAELVSLLVDASSAVGDDDDSASQ